MFDVYLEGRKSDPLSVDIHDVHTFRQKKRPHERSFKIVPGQTLNRPERDDSANKHARI
jgi:hypothetical protein